MEQCDPENGNVHVRELHKAGDLVVLPIPRSADATGPP